MYTHIIALMRKLAQNGKDENGSVEGSHHSYNNILHVNKKQLRFQLNVN